jgi:hypothetical protein
VIGDGGEVTSGVEENKTEVVEEEEAAVERAVLATHARAVSRAGGALDAALARGVRDAVRSASGASAWFTSQPVATAASKPHFQVSHPCYVASLNPKYFSRGI